MLRAILISGLLIGASAAAFADDDDRDRRGRQEYRQDRHDRGDRHWNDRRDDRRWQGRRDHDDRRRWDDRGRHDDRRYGRDWRGRDRVYVVPAPPVYGYRYARPRDWYPGWREPYRGGYRYWQNDRYWYVAPGRPAVELSLVFPLR